MSTHAHSHPWSPSEKIDLLVKILEGAVSDVPSLLLPLVLHHGFPPRWQEISLPQGRSVYACQAAFEDMRRRALPHPSPSQPSAPTTQYANIAPAVPQKRSFSEQDPPLSAQRQLQPRPFARSTDSPAPPVTNGSSPVFVRATHFESGSELPKKRGRPSKAEVEVRDRQLALEGKVYQPKKRSSKKARPSVGISVPNTKSEDQPLGILQTPLTQATQAREDTSSGKRRARRPPRDEATESPTNHEYTPTESEPVVAASPSDRLLASRRDRVGTLPPVADASGQNVHFLEVREGPQSRGERGGG